MLEIDPPRVPEFMREGWITSRFERGKGEDEGRFRITSLHENMTVRLIAAADGTMRHQSRVRGVPIG